MEYAGEFFRGGIGDRVGGKPWAGVEFVGQGKHLPQERIRGLAGLNSRDILERREHRERLGRPSSGLVPTLFQAEFFAQFDGVADGAAQ